MNGIPRLITLTLFGSLLTGSFVLAQDNIILKNGTEIPAKVLEVSSGQIKYRRQDNPDGPIYSTGTTDVLLIKYANGTKDILSEGRPAVGSSSPTLRAVPGPGVTPSESSTPALNKLTYHHGLFSRYYVNGADERIDRNQVQMAFADHPDAMRAYRRGQSLRRWSYVTAGSALALLGAGAVVSIVGDGGGTDNHRNGSNDNATTNDRIDNGFERQGDHGSTEVGLALAGGGVLLGVTAFILDNRATVQFRRAANRYNSHQTTSLRFGPSSRGLGIGVALTF